MNKGFVALDVTSTSVHLYRAPWMDAAKNEYLEAKAYRESVCKSTKKKIQDTIFPARAIADMLP